MSLTLWTLTFVVALAVLLKASGVLVSGASKLVKTLGWSSFFVGMTVLAIGTSLPELASSLWAMQNNTTSLVASNVIGSNIANILLILGLGAVVYKGINLSSDSSRSLSGLLLGSTFLLMVTVYDGTIQWFEGLLLIAAFIIYLLHNAAEFREGRFEALKDWFHKESFSAQLLLTLILSGAATLASSYFVVKALEEIASKAHLMPSVLGASALALGTSLPELAVTFAALKKGKVDMAIGTLIGSSIFNATLVLGLPSLFHSIVVTSDMLTLGLPFLLMSTFLLLFALRQRKLSSYEGAIYVLLYGVFSFQLLASF